MITMMDAIVLMAVALALGFLAAWVVSPRLRLWIERPKYRFLRDVQRYEQGQDHAPEHSATR